MAEGEIEDDETGGNHRGAVEMSRTADRLTH